MTDYEPELAPLPEQWLALSEDERLSLVKNYHERARVQLPNAPLHAVIHTIIETQLAERVPEVVTALERLRREGLDRHEALHAIGSVLAPHLVKLLQDGAGSDDPNAEYFAELKSLTASQWRTC